MIKKRKLISVVLSVIMVLTILAACGNNGANNTTVNNVENNQQTPAPDDATPTNTEDAKGSLASEEPIELSIHLIVDGIPYNDDWAAFKKIAELTNVSLKGSVSKNVTDTKEIFNLMMATNDLSDIVRSSKVNFDKFGAEGAFVPLNELIDEHAPNLKAFLEEHPDVRKIATAADGNMYYVPFTPDGAAATGWFLRNDWLEAVGMETPKTVDDYHAVLTAFKEKDPNKNGKADEIPYFHGATGFGIYFLLSLWDAKNDFYIDGEEVKYGPLDPSYKEGMANLSQWYAEGLIDKEIFTRGGSARETLLTDNIGGSTHDWFGSTAGFNNTLADQIPGFEFAPIAPPASTSGLVAEYDFRPSVRDVGWGISSSNPNPIETIKYFDFFLSEEGRRIMNFGVEGETYTMVDGKPTFTEEILSASNVVSTLKKDYGVQVEIGFHQNFDYELQWMNPIAKIGVEEYINNGYIVKTRLPNMALTVDEQARIKELTGPINTFREETGQKWVLGAEKVDAGYNKFVEQLKQMNIEELLTLYNEAYQRYLSQ